jgi:copper chaperone NosL
MKKRTVLSLVATICLVWGGMASGQGKDDFTLHKDCSRCGMSRVTFDFSRMLIQYSDGATVGICSLRCAVDDLADNPGKTAKSIRVADFSGRHLIEAEKAFWVVGGNRPGVMTGRGKWAFEKKDDAEAFVKVNEGKIFSFQETMMAAREESGDAARMNREKREKMGMKTMEPKPGAGR